MEHSMVIHSRNMYIILFYIASVIVHLIIGPFLGNTNEIITAFFGFFSIIVLIILHRRRINPLVLRIFIVIGYDIYVFLVNLLIPNTAHLLYLIFPIILTVVCNRVWLNMLVTAITGIEVITLLYLFGPTYILEDQIEFLSHFAFVFTMVTILCTLHTFKIGPIWKSINTENIRMDAILTSKKGYLDLYFKHAEDAIAVFSLDQKIITINPAFEKMYGWKKKDCIGKTPRLFPLSEDTEAEKRTRNVLNGKSYHLLRTKEMRKDGSVFDAELTIAPIYDENKKMVAMSFIARDITLKLQAEKLKIDTEKVKAIGEIAATVAHEVRNPMTTISGFVQMMNNDPTNPYRTYTDIMYSEINRIDLIVSEFLILSKPNLKNSTEFYIQDTIRQTVAMFKLEFTTRSIFCNLEFQANRSMINGNEDSIKQVFLNLITNACEAIVKSGTITITVTQQKEAVIITFCDDGPGMDQAILGNLFEPFFTTKQDGTGLGMMITKKIIIDHDGTLTVTSAKNEGTKTVITLPLINK